MGRALGMGTETYLASTCGVSRTADGSTTDTLWSRLNHFGEHRLRYPWHTVVAIDLNGCPRMGAIQAKKPACAGFSPHPRHSQAETANG
jgi:hypothetical protein